MKVLRSVRGQRSEGRGVPSRSTGGFVSLVAARLHRTPPPGEEEGRRRGGL